MTSWIAFDGCVRVPAKLSKFGSGSNAVLAGALVCSLAVCAEAGAADDAALDMEFLEYLGSWEESEEDWVLLTDEAADPATEEDAARTERVAGEQDGVER